MPRVRYLGGGGYHIRGGPDFEHEGDEADVDEATAKRLTDRIDFEAVAPPAEDAAGKEDGPPDDRVPVEDLANIIDDGTCPWCDEYDGDAVGRHASSAHPEKWDDYKQRED